MSSLKEIGERKLIENIKKFIRPSKDVLGTEDDAAILGTDGVVACTDVVTFDRHMPEGMTYEKFGWMAASVNFSDLAAMGATPIGLLVSMAMPEDMEETDFYDIVSGIDQCAEFCETAIVGGDTKFGSGVISCTALGTMNGRKPMMRNGANAGDIVAVTGSLGGPAAGYYALKNNIEAEDAIFSLMTPVPMVKEGELLSKTGKVTSCIDLSDGLATAANIICEQSRIGMEIVWEFLPEAMDVDEISVATKTSKEDMMLNFGGEYELMFTFAKKDLKTIQESGVYFSIIGHMTGDDGPYLLKNDERTKLGYGKY